MERITPDIETEFQPVEDALQEALFLAFFKGDTSQIPGRTVSCLPVKQVRIALTDPTQTSGAN